MPPSVLPKLDPNDFLYVAPEIFLVAWGLVVLAVDFTFLRKASGPSRRRSLGLLSLVGVVIGMVLLSVELPERNGTSLFFGTLSGDILTSRLNFVILALLACVVGMSMAWEFTEHWGEYFALLFWAGVGMMLLIASEELVTLFLTLETMTLCLYMATAFEKTKLRSAEGGLKYFVYGSVSSALFLFGLSYIYGLTGTTRLDAIAKILADSNARGLAGNVAGATAVLLVLVGFGFKIAAVPFHQWAPDAYEGAPAPVTAWVATGSKVASFVAIIKVLVVALGPWAHRSGSLTSPGWVSVVAAIAAVSMTYGNLAALAQRNLKRMLAYSSIAHAGYMLVGVLAASVSVNHYEATGAILFYLVIYGFTTMGAFALAAWLARDKNSDDINDLNGLGYRSPGMAICIVILMLSLIGMPPFAGFFGKLYMFMEAIDTYQLGRNTLVWLVGLALVNSVISAFYYVRVLKAMFLRPPGQVPVAPPTPAISLPILVGSALAVGCGFYPAPLLNSMKDAAVLSFSAPAEAPSANKKFVTKPDPRFILTPEQLKKKQQEGMDGRNQPNVMLIRPIGGAMGGGPPGGGGRPPLTKKGATPKKGNAPQKGAQPQGKSGATPKKGAPSGPS